MTVNGIDTEQVAGFAQLLTSDPDLADITVSTRHRWEGGYTLATQGAGITVAGDVLPRDEQHVVSDRPGLFGGGDRGCVPGELLLAALSSCVGSQLVEHAALRGVELGGLELVAEGRLDLRGTLEAPGVPVGLRDVTLDVEVSSTVDGQVLGDLLALAVRTSPVAATLGAGVPVRPSVRHATP
jgi:uncharacterized OsmC-like protein